jgi:hypothetical protein
MQLLDLVCQSTSERDAIAKCVPPTKTPGAIPVAGWSDDMTLTIGMQETKPKGGKAKADGEEDDGDELAGKSADDLRALGGELGLDLPRSMTKAQMIALIREAQEQRQA